MSMRSTCRSSHAFQMMEPLEDRRLLSTVTLDFNGGAGGIADTGFSSVLATSHGKGLIASKLSLGGGRLTIASTAGDLVGTTNNQDNALDLNVDATRNFIVQTRLAGLPFNKSVQSGGIFIGTGEDNYVKLVAGYNAGQILQLASESGAIFTSALQPTFKFTGITSLDLRLVGNAASQTLTASYRVNSDSDTAWVVLGSVSNSAAMTSASKAGILTTNFGSKISTSVPFESFSLQNDDATYPSGSVLTVGANINTSKLAGSESTGQIAMNPTNPNNLVIVSQSGDNHGALLPLSTSFDGGKTWSTQLVGAQDGFNAGNPRPDGHVAFDSFGNLYLTYMVAASPTEIRLAVLRSTNGGQTFTSLGTAETGTTYSPDAPWIATGVDAANHAHQHVWISFTDYASNRVMIVGGVSTGLGRFSGWSTPKTVSQSFGTYSTVAVGPAGQLAVSWQSTDSGSVVANKLMINSDSTGTAAHFSADEWMADTNVGGFDYIAAQPDRSVDAEARIAFDKSGGAANGRLYLVYTNQPIDGTDNTDIYLKYSDTLGSAWSNAVKVNDDTTGNSQFIPAIAVDQTTGNVGLSWMDCRNSATNTGAQLFATVSLDHGQSVQPNVQISAGMSYQAGADPNTNDLDFGDSGSLVFNAGKLIPVWSDNANTTGDNAGGTGASLDLYTDVILVAAPTTASTTLASSMVPPATMTTATITTTATTVTGSILKIKGKVFA
jgi:hypothetical protein